MGKILLFILNWFQHVVLFNYFMQFSSLRIDKFYVSATECFVKFNRTKKKKKN